jgi:hypothetical protein
VIPVPADVDFRLLIERLRAEPVVEAAFGTQASMLVRVART